MTVKSEGKKEKNGNLDAVTLESIIDELLECESIEVFNKHLQSHKPAYSIRV